MNQPRVEKKSLSQSIVTRYLVFVAIQVGCFTFVIVFVALLVGLWLDRFFQSNGLLVILIILASVPLTWFIVWRLVKQAKKHIKGSSHSETCYTEAHEEEDTRDVS